MAPKQITLFPHQQNHVEELKTILQRSPFAFDLSMLGAGKTYAAATIAQDFNHTIVACPLSVKSKWQSMASYGPKIERVMSFAEVRSTAGCRNPKHGFLTREDTEEHAPNGTVMKHTSFSPTAKLSTMAQEGTLLIVDEVQNIKNQSTQTTAVAMLIQTVINNGGKILILSGSPIDKPEQLITLFGSLGVITQQLVTFTVHSRTFDYPGYRQLVDYVRRFALPLHPDQPTEWEVNNLLALPRGDTRSAITKVYKIFQHLIKPAIARAMPPFEAPVAAVEIRKRNGFYAIVNQEDATALEDAVDKLERAVGYDGKSNTINFQQQNMLHGNQAATMSGLTKSLLAIEKAKASTFARLARETLMQNPSGKVAVCLNYREPIALVVAMLGDYHPLQLHGSMTAEARAATLAKFQAPGGHRVLVCNLSVCATGVDLDDKVGNEPRTVFVSPSYHTITQYQLSHRFKRLDTRSSTELFMVYGRRRFEVKVLNALAKKSAIVKEVADGSCGVLPCDYESYYEPGSEGPSGSNAPGTESTGSTSDDDLEMIEILD